MDSCLKVFCYFILTVNFNGYSQSINDSYLNTLDSLERVFLKLNKSKKENFAESYLNLAKQERNSYKITIGYYLKSLAYSHSEIAVAYSDSIIQETKLNNNELFLARGYLQKGIQLYYLSEHIDALDNYTKANKIFLKYNNSYHLIRIKHYIALLKSTSDQNEEALKIAKENYNYFNESPELKEKYENQYFKSLFALIEFYKRKKKLDSAITLTKSAISESHKSNSEMYPYFLMSYGANKISNKKFNFKIHDSLLKSTKLIEHNKKSLCDSYIVISMGYDLIKDTISAIEYLKKVDSIYDKWPEVITRAKTANQKLYNYYKQRSDYQKQLSVINRILSIDTIINKKYSNLDKKITEKYDIPSLISEKEKLIEVLKAKNSYSKTGIWFSLILCLSLLILLYYFHLIRKREKLKYDILIKSLEDEEYLNKIKKQKNTLLDTKTDKHYSDIPKSVVEDILGKLRMFELSNKFVQKYTLNSLAKEFKTNSSYLSNIINSNMNTNFANYLNNLRIDYSINKLKNEKKFRDYTIKAIAIECGFNTAQSFSKAFHKKTGIYPSYFIKKLNSS